jgi:hypothetical protein
LSILKLTQILRVMIRMDYLSLIMHYEQVFCSPM